jgi:coproporphyrinogen III oxidase-like Fe-S oxidoreductase
MDEIKKNTDDSWKESVEKEKETIKKEGDFTAPEANFNFFVTSLALQATIAMGVMENPVTNKKEESLPQAKFLIDTLVVLKEKTKGNLTDEENSLLENVLYELRMQYMGKTKGPGA